MKGSRQHNWQQHLYGGDAPDDSRNELFDSGQGEASRINRCATELLLQQFLYMVVLQLLL
jgi:hypothetical protein